MLEIKRDAPLVRAFRISRRKRDLRHLRHLFVLTPNIEPSKTIKPRFMMYDKLSISTCACHLTTKTLAHILKNYDENSVLLCSNKKT